MTPPHRGTDGGRITVVVADDDYSTRQVLRLMLEIEGFAIVEAANGEDAVSIAAAHAPGFVILDHMMPGLDGEIASRRIRSLIPGVVVVAFSGFLIRKPYWSDLFVPKGRIGDLPSLIKSNRARRQADFGAEDGASNPLRKEKGTPSLAALQRRSPPAVMETETERSDRRWPPMPRS